MYRIIPIDQLCPFTNVYLIDLSFNRITNLTNAFRPLWCLISIKYFNLSYNQISTPILATDFEDTFPSRLVEFYLNNNRIPSIEAQAFIKTNGESRFPNLRLLELSNNQIKVIDILWPLTLPNPILDVKLNNNSINNITNLLQRPFNDDIFHPMIGNRNVDLKFNSINRLDDANLLQYGMSSGDDFLDFLYILSNYDFGRNSSAFLCICPPLIGSYTVLWYKEIANQIQDKSAPIYNIFCSNPRNVYIFNFPCVVSFFFIFFKLFYTLPLILHT